MAAFVEFPPAALDCPETGPGGPPMMVSMMVVRTVVYKPGGFCAADAVALELCWGAAGADACCAEAEDAVTAPG